MPSDALGDAASTTAVPLPAVTRGHDRPSGLSLRHTTDWLRARAMFVIAVSAVLILCLLGMPRHSSQDGRLALISGRVVAMHGVQSTITSHI